MTVASDQIVDGKEARRLLGRNGKLMAYSTLQRLVDSGELPATRIGGRYYIRMSAIEALLPPTVKRAESA